MDKPKPKREVAISSYSKSERVIFFHASRDAADEFQDFGFVHEGPIGYMLFVDTRYDFDEVLAYMEQYG